MEGPIPPRATGISLKREVTGMIIARNIMEPLSGDLRVGGAVNNDENIFFLKGKKTVLREDPPLWSVLGYCLVS